MTLHRWAAVLPPDELGVVVHGPVLLGRSPGIAAGLRCVFAHPGGLRLPFVLRASGVQAEAAGRRTFSRPRDEAGVDGPWSGVTLHVEVDGVTGIADAAHQESSGSADVFALESTYWIDRLPGDGRLRLTVAWPQAGLAETTTELELDDLGGLDGRVVPLP
ncbi:hypothetical protein E4P40_19555 [Blastococcus sp. CT_GayMR20]|uniref:hypothetical protein n=1 Tax=Blastococcus sp. CT_GayMR20 TaxID=2559609 RepID=UPI001073F414|nr:hypothetical protein [Blastococcus sp. CT_GayMR20]TFV75052.1 hypothetical protein E4P40_19555 [Blastococcus sp. CT_GayMR20]